MTSAATSPPTRGRSTASIYTTAYTYESAGRLEPRSPTPAPAGWSAYTRDSAGQITSVTATQPGHGATNLATSRHAHALRPASPRFTYGNGVTDTRTFDLDYRMTSMTDHGTGNIQYLSYGYDADNNVTRITDNVTPANNQTLTYDAIDRADLRIRRLRHRQQRHLRLNSTA